MPRCVRTAHVFEKKWRSDDVRLQEEASFSSLLLPEKILVGLENAGYKTPSPIQLESIPVGRFGRDLLVQAKSGTGKTLVFTVIALESLSDIKYPQVLIMAPTREIALQIRDVVRAVGSAFKGLTCNSFIGGISVDTDIERVHGCQIIVGTPGRLKHLISLGILPTNSIRLLVLDEADVLLESNFKDDLDYIFVSLPKEKQVIATSATYPRELRTLTRQYFRKAYLARLNRNELTLLGMVHYIQVLELPKMSLLAYKAKLAALEKVVTSVQFTQCLVFCNLISRVESLCYDIRNWGFTSTFISSAKEQCDRIRAIECLKRFRCKILVTSDITSRGIDAENVDLVVNFDKPLSTEVYFHRCGRAGRYGAKGVAITFLEKDEVLAFEQMKVKHNLKAYNLPDPIPTNLINIRPRDSSTESSEEEDEDSSDDVSKLDSDDLNNHSSDITKEGKKPKKKSGADSLCNGKISSNLNENLIENNGVNEPTSPSKGTNCKLDTPGECNDMAIKENGCATHESSDLDSIQQSSISEVFECGDNHESIENGKENFGTKSNGKVASEITVTNEFVKEKNSFLEYLESKSAKSSSPALVSDSIVTVNNDIIPDITLSQELKNDATVLVANCTGLQNDTQHSSNVLCLKNNSLEADSQDFNQGVSKKDITENNEKLISPSDTLESLIQVENDNVISIDTPTPLLPNTSVSDKVPKGCVNESKNKFVPNKVQLSVGKFLIEQMGNCDVNNLTNNSNSTDVDPSSSNKDSSTKKTETELDITETLKDIRGDLTDFYSKVYNAYRSENINETAFEDIKDLLIQQKGEEIKKSAEENIAHAEISTQEMKNSDEEIGSETILDKFNKENGQNPPDLKFCNINECNGSLYYKVSNESISSEEDNTSEVDQVFDRFVFKDNLADNSLNSSDSSCIENSYLALKGTLDAMKSSEKSSSKTNSQASQKTEKKKCVAMKKKKFSANADKRQHSSPVIFKRLSDSECSKVSSSDEDTENKLQELNGAKKRVYNERQTLKRESNKCHRAKNNKSKGQNKTKPSNAVRIGEEHNRTSSTVSEASENLHSSQYGHNSSTPHFKVSKSATNGYPPTKSAANYGNIPSTSHHHDCITNTANYGNIPYTSHPHQHNTHAMKYANISSANQTHDYNTNAVNYGNIPSMGRPRRHNTSTVNFGNISSTSRPHEHTTSAVNYRNFPPISHHCECQLPNYPYSHQANGYTPLSYAPNQANVSQGNYHQLGHNCSASWNQIYREQWQFIHSSLF